MQRGVKHCAGSRLVQPRCFRHNDIGLAAVEFHSFHHIVATWAIENRTRERDVRNWLGYSTPAIVRRYSATYDAAKAAGAHAASSPSVPLFAQRPSD